MATNAKQVEWLKAGSRKADGTVNADGKVFFFSAGTTNDKAVYADYDKTAYTMETQVGGTLNGKEYVLLDADGKPEVSGGNVGVVFGDGLYDEHVYDSDDNLIDTNLSQAYHIPSDPTSDTHPAFSANQGGAGATTLVTDTWILVDFDTEVYDVGGFFDTTTHAWTPTVVGKYLLTAQITVASMSDGEEIGIAIYKDGVLTASRFATLGLATSNAGISITVTLDSDGSNAFTVRGRSSEAADASSTDTAITETFFMGVKVG